MNAYMNLSFAECLPWLVAVLGQWLSLLAVPVLWQRICEICWVASPVPVCGWSCSQCCCRQHRPHSKDWRLFCEEAVQPLVPRISNGVTELFFFLNVSCSSTVLFSVRTNCVLQLGHLSFWILSKEWSSSLSKKKTYFCFNLWNLKNNFLSYLKIVSCKQRHVSLEEKLFSQSKH